MYEFPSYRSPMRAEKRDAAEIITGAVEVVVTEKIDGSQFKIHKDPQGVVWFGTKSRTIPHDQFGGFINGTDALRELRWIPGWVYFGEYLARPKQNKLAYDRTPPHNVILFDVMDETGAYLPRESVVAEAVRLGLMVVPLVRLDTLPLDDFAPDSLTVAEWLREPSCLGGQTLEGVVAKVYHEDGRLEQVKVVRTDFQEVGKKAVATGDVMDRVNAVGTAYLSSARWDKALQTVRDSGDLTGTKKDIGTCFRALNADLLTDCRPEMEQALAHYLSDIPFADLGIPLEKLAERGASLGSVLFAKFGKTVLKRATAGFAPYVENGLGL